MHPENDVGPATEPANESRLRSLVREEVQAIRPFDDLERAQLLEARAWIDAGAARAAPRSAPAPLRGQARAAQPAPRAVRLAKANRRPRDHLRARQITRGVRASCDSKTSATWRDWCRASTRVKLRNRLRTRSSSASPVCSMFPARGAAACTSMTSRCSSEHRVPMRLRVRASSCASSAGGQVHVISDSIERIAASPRKASTEAAMLRIRVRPDEEPAQTAGSK